MAGLDRSNHPDMPWRVVALDGRPSGVKVRQLHRRLWAAAKQSEGRRFHALFDRVHRGDVLWEAWERVRRNRGAAGVDRVTLAMVEEYGVERMLAGLQHQLRTGSYRPAPARRVDIPKPAGANRVGTRIEWVVEDLNPILRGWGNYFRTGNAATKFVQVDRYVAWRLHRLQVKKRGRNLHAGQADQWTEAWFNDKGLYRLRGTIRYPKAA